MSSQKPRQIAVRVLDARSERREFTEDLLDRELQSQHVTTSDRGLIQEIVYGVARNEAALDWLIARKTEGRTQKEQLRTLLHLGLYQLFWLDRVPNHAAVHETVEIAKQLGLGPQAGFINAVLRGYTRERVETEKLLLDLKVEKPAIAFSHPEWLYERWLARLGAETTAALMQWNNTPPPTFARVNTLKTSTVPIQEIWASEKVEVTAREFDWCPPGSVFQMMSHPPIAAIRSFQEGRFYIQDPSTLLAVSVLDPKPNDSVLDLCAAPGGKTTAIAQRMQNRGRIAAQDIAEDRLALIRENCARLGVTIAEASLAPNGIIANPSKKFDRILVDAPCSNTGVMRRRIDLRYRIQPDEITRLAAEQAQILEQAAPRLKPGGTLVYSTCSLEPEENEQMVQQFLGKHPEFKKESERALLPWVDGVDGAYVAKLVKAQSAPAVLI